LDVGEIGNGVERGVLHGVPTPADEHERRQQDEKAVVD